MTVGTFTVRLGLEIGLAKGLACIADNLLSDDMLSGEEEDGPGQGRHGRANDAPQQFSEEEDEDEDGWDGAADADEQRDVLNSSEDDDEDDAELAPSAHARRQQRMQEKIRYLL